MTTPGKDTPLTPAEALVLLDPDKPQGRTALKRTLMDLLARRVLTLDRRVRKGFLGTTERADRFFFAPDGKRRAEQSPHVLAVLSAIQAAQGQGAGAPMREFVRHAREVFGADFSGYQKRYVLPALVERGLLVPRQERALWVFPVTRHRHTPGGEDARRRVERQMAAARSLPEYLDRDPARAAALAIEMGSMILLVDGMRPHHRRLSEAMRSHQGGGGDVSVADPPFEASGHERTPPAGAAGEDFGRGDFGSVDFDGSAFDALDSSLDAFDASFDASAGDGGGGDGGGGD